MTQDAVLELNSVACRYGATQVLDEINPSIARGEFTALLGSSGCGKTTLLRVLAGFITPPPALSPSLVFMLIVERFLKADVLSRVGR
ncbi:ATP-binding cassette domain-containing protein [Rhizobium sullae]|uniref:ABC transporter family protein n=1 Tax=Rhizobium sullae TaxID=50338 RepID=A0A4R3Q2K6_RHISU|nr:ATP-binding cassette domain-containing protein [Rhizobium sullae]TCU13372.1 ABC transporter family protein [Rhizobium sullae]